MYKELFIVKQKIWVLFGNASPQILAVRKYITQADDVQTNLKQASQKWLKKHVMSKMKPNCAANIHRWASANLREHRILITDSHPMLIMF